MNNPLDQIVISESLSISPLLVALILASVSLVIKMQVDRSKKMTDAIRKMLENYRSMLAHTTISVTNEKDISVIRKAVGFEEFSEGCTRLGLEMIGYFTQSSRLGIVYNCSYWIPDISSILTFVKSEKEQEAYCLELIHTYNNKYDIGFNHPTGLCSFDLPLFVGPLVT